MDVNGACLKLILQEEANSMQLQVCAIFLNLGESQAISCDIQIQDIPGSPSAKASLCLLPSSRLDSRSRDGLDSIVSRFASVLEAELAAAEFRL